MQTDYFLFVFFLDIYNQWYSIFCNFTYYDELLEKDKNTSSKLRYEQRITIILHLHTSPRECFKLFAAYIQRFYTWLLLLLLQIVFGLELVVQIPVEMWKVATDWEGFQESTYHLCPLRQE